MSFDTFMIARESARKLKYGISHIVTTKSQYEDPILNYLTCNVHKDVINYGRCANSLYGRLWYQLLKAKQVL